VGDVELRLDNRLGAVARLDVGQFAGAISYDLRQLEEQAAAVVGGRVLPRPFVEGRPRGLHCGVHVLRVSVRRLRNDFGGGWVDDVDGVSGGRVDVLAVDVKLVWFHRHQTTTIFTNH